MTKSEGTPLPGCRHDVLGHALKAVGLLRALAQCGPDGTTDPNVEGWWDLANACFRIQSQKYPTQETLREFFAQHYEPTAIIAAWNKSGGVTDKVEVKITTNREGLSEFRLQCEKELLRLGMKKTTKVTTAGKLTIKLRDAAAVEALREMASRRGLRVHIQPTPELTQVTLSSDPRALHQFREQFADRLADLGFASDKKPSKAGEIKFAVDTTRQGDVQSLVSEFERANRPEPVADSDADAARADTPSCSRRLELSIEPKESGKIDGTLPEASRLMEGNERFRDALAAARAFVPRLQNEDDDSVHDEGIFFEFRDGLEDSLSESFDSLCAIHVRSHVRGQNDNPLFIRRGRPGNKVRNDIFLNFWDYFVRFKKQPNDYVDASLFALGTSSPSGVAGHVKDKGTPFFPDAVKRFNQGLEWVTEDAPFCPLDYILAVEGALAMRGATSKTLNAHSRARAAFPFVFDGSDTMTDENGDLVGNDVSASFWFPLWSQPATYSELLSFILDAQTRLPAKECRFSGDFARAVRSHGVDAGFAAFQEFRFKLKGASVPWTVAGRLVPCTSDPGTTVLNEVLTPVDANGFLEQFEFHRKAKDDLHRYRLPVLQAIDDAVAEPSSTKVVEVLCRVGELNALLARSRSLREKVISSGRVGFIPALASRTWDSALADLEGDAEFEIARALASIGGHERQSDEGCSEVEPFLGSLLPLRRRGTEWRLPMKPEAPSPQAVWSGSDLCFDLAAILARRHLDSAKDERLALVGRRMARLTNILAFLRGELDDRRIARLAIGLSLVDWRFAKGGDMEPPDTRDAAGGPDESAPIPFPYAVLRALIEVGCERQTHTADGKKQDRHPSARSPQAIAWVCQRTPELTAGATVEALRRLAIVGVRNCYGRESREQKQRLCGRDVVSLARCPDQLHLDPQLCRRLAAAVLTPLDWRDRWMIFRSVTLPQTAK